MPAGLHRQECLCHINGLQRKVAQTFLSVRDFFTAPDLTDHEPGRTKTRGRQAANEWNNPAERDLALAD